MKSDVQEVRIADIANKWGFGIWDNLQLNSLLIDLAAGYFFVA